MVFFVGRTKVYIFSAWKSHVNEIRRSCFQRLSEIGWRRLVGTWKDDWKVARRNFVARKTSFFYNWREVSDWKRRSNARKPRRIAMWRRKIDWSNSESQPFVVCRCSSRKTRSQGGISTKRAKTSSDRPLSFAPKEIPWRERWLLFRLCLIRIHILHIVLSRKIDLFSRNSLFSLSPRIFYFWNSFYCNKILYPHIFAYF